jgi:protein associated with RNAse G/E
LKEFEQNSKRFNYPPEIISQTENALIELQKKILEKEFPFSKICKMLTYN